MGVTICNEEKEIDMGYGSFYVLRKSIAYMISEELGDLYQAMCLKNEKWGHLTTDEYHKEVSKLFNAGTLDNSMRLCLDFLHQSDCGGKISSKTCTEIYKVIKDCDDEKVIGRMTTFLPSKDNEGRKAIKYAEYERNIPATMGDLKSMLKWCGENSKPLKWW